MFYIVSFYPPNKGGAEMFLKEIQEWIENDGKECCWVNNIDDVQDDADIVITSGKQQTHTAICADRRGIPCIVLIQHWKEVYDPITKVVDNQFFKLIQTKAILATCSRFLRKEILNLCKHYIPRILYPVSHKPNPLGIAPPRDGYILVPNISKDKGGSMFYDLMKYGVPLVGISHSKSQLEKLIVETAKHYHHVMVIETPLDQHDYFQLLRESSMLLCAPEVNETFCRAAWEAMCANIPVVCNRRGNLPYLFGHEGNYVETASDVARMYKSGCKGINKSQFFCPEQGKALFWGMVEDAICLSPKAMFMGPWSDQGLGIQLKRYVDGTNNVVFSLKCAINNDIVFQSSSLDWIHGRVHWSEFSRKHVSQKEIQKVIKSYNVDNLYILEPSGNIFNELEGLSCNVIAIPNIELVRKDELDLYSRFTQIICHTRQCFSFMKRFRTAVYFPFEFTSISAIPRFSKPVKYLAIGGSKPFGRKQIKHVIEVFSELENCMLTVTWQVKQEEVVSKNVNIICQSLTRHQILDLYRTHDVVVNLSCQEGLGLSIIEPLELGKPVIATDMPPHNEYVIHEKNGWLIRGTPCVLHDNPSPLFQGKKFEKQHLRETIIHINKKYCK